MFKKHKKLLYIQEQFSEIKMNHRSGNVERNLKSIARSLKSLYKIDVDITLVNNDGMDFFGMAVYPSKDLADIVVDRLTSNEPKPIQDLEKVWAENKDWVIEIDSQILTNMTLNLSPDEMTAMLLHEIGHTVYNNRVIVRLYDVYRYTLMTLPIPLKKLMMWRGARNLLKLPLIQACAQKSYNTRAIHEEKHADMFVIKQGYGDELISMMNRIIETFGNQYMDKSEADHLTDLKSIMAWSVDTVSQLEHRYAHAERALNTQLRMTKSPYVHMTIQDIKDTLTGKGRNDLRNFKPRFIDMVRKEHALKQKAENENIENIIVTEGFVDWFDKSQRRAKPIHGSDIDVIEIEIDRIQTESDRIFVLDMIYNRMDIIDYQIELLQDPSTSSRVITPQKRLEGYKEQLEDMRKRVLNTKVPPKKYGVIIQYPTNYEG